MESTYSIDATPAIVNRINDGKVMVGDIIDVTVDISSDMDGVCAIESIYYNDVDVEDLMDSNFAITPEDEFAAYQDAQEHYADHVYESMKDGWTPPRDSRSEHDPTL